MTARRHQSGVTLLELLIALSIISILTTITLSSWSRLVEQSRHQSIITAYQSGFAYARWVAASERAIVTVCPLSSSGKCTDNWNQRVSIFIDNNNDKKPDDRAILTTIQKPSERYVVTSRTGGRGYIQFNHLGMIHGAAGGIVVCPATDRPESKISYMALNKGGRFRSVHELSSVGKIKLKWGATITCPPI